ncbi:MAG TPA: hypothetical protein VKA85_10435 [Candidatus Limnocylindrales bacterium]|nr:hypothetical protein [Candidatus Limnocylindrales bacterium]
MGRRIASAVAVAAAAGALVVVAVWVSVQVWTAIRGFVGASLMTDVPLGVSSFLWANAVVVFVVVAAAHAASSLFERRPGT